jgi:integrase
MGTKSLKSTVSVERINKRLRLRWRYQKKRFCLNLFAYNKTNLLRAKKIAVQIENDIASGTFDISVKRYKPVGA